MGTVERRTREKARLRQEILDAARTIFVEEGYDALTMRRVAKAIEYSPTAIYLYFKDKAELVQALCDETFGKLVKRLQDLAKKQLDPLEYVEAGLRAYIDFGLKNPNHYYVTFIASPGRIEYPYEGSGGQRAFEFLRSCVQRCVETGAFRRVDVDTTAQALWMAAHGLVALLISNKPFPFVARQRLVDHLMETQLRGLRP
jgi:AcrR family transcriptional regulator